MPRVGGGGSGAKELDGLVGGGGRPELFTGSGCGERSEDNAAAGRGTRERASGPLCSEECAAPAASEVWVRRGGGPAR
eukprot:6740635-Heterocapsa_arctica.AAC.1